MEIKEVDEIEKIATQIGEEEVMDLSEAEEFKRTCYAQTWKTFAQLGKEWRTGVKGLVVVAQFYPSLKQCFSGYF